jgi:hypothetical protein
VPLVLAAGGRFGFKLIGLNTLSTTNLGNIQGEEI